MAKRQINPDFHIILESSLVYAGGPERLLSAPLSAAIHTLAKTKHVKLHWYVPGTVLGERRFQMVEAAQQLVGNLQKVERLVDGILVFRRLRSKRLSTAQ
jgi:hypothetical protein